jgi:8-oxo-dGTP pyrophosphatase MutT (NUDIX family)
MKTIFHNTAGLVVIKITNSVPHVLVIKRVWEFAPEGTYILPKGHVEEGENLQEAAIRETTEETGFSDFANIQDLCDVTITYQKTNTVGIIEKHEKNITWFLAELNSEEKVNINLTQTELDSQEFILQWLELKGSEELVKFEADKKPLSEAQKILFT